MITFKFWNDYFNIKQTHSNVIIIFTYTFNGLMSCGVFVDVKC